MEMAQEIILLVALSVFTAQSAVLRNEDTIHTRIARSPCYSCEHNHGPPPPVLRTQNWSGYARSADGSQQGVFSGAAAAAGTGNEASGQAFSIAASDAGSGTANYAQNDQSAKFADKYSHGAYGGNVQSTQSNLEGFNSASTAQSSGSGSGQSNVGSGFGYGQSESGQHPVKLLNDGNSRPNAVSSANAQAGGQEQYRDQGSKFFANQGAVGVQGQYQESGHKEDSAYQNQGGAQNSGLPLNSQQQNEIPVNRGDVANEQQQQHYTPSSHSYANNRGEVGGQEQNQGFGQKQNSAYHSNDGGQGGYQNLGSQKSSSYYGGAGGHRQYEGSAQQEISSYHDNNGGQGQVPVSGSQATSQYYGNTGQEQQLQSNYAQGGYRRRSGSRKYGASEQGNEQSVLGGAIDLASQGLKASEGAQNGCSSCGKNSYAVSNAKSRTGSAIAVSVGG